MYTKKSTGIVNVHRDIIHNKNLKLTCPIGDEEIKCGTHPYEPHIGNTRGSSEIVQKVKVFAITSGTDSMTSILMTHKLLSDHPTNTHMNNKQMLF